MMIDTTPHDGTYGDGDHGMGGDDEPFWRLPTGYNDYGNGLEGTPGGDGWGTGDRDSGALPHDNMLLINTMR